MKHHNARIRGLTMLEAMFLMITLSIVALGAGIGLQAVAKVPAQTDATLAINAAIVSRLETMKSEPWASMSTRATALSTAALPINNKNYACTVAVADADPDASGATDTDYRTVTVTIGGQSISTCVTQP